MADNDIHADRGPPPWTASLNLLDAPKWLRELAGTLMQEQIDDAKTLLAQHGFVVLKAKSYRAAQQRQHIAEAIARYADEQRESTERWAQTTLHNEIRELMARCTFLYGVARAHGANVDELAGGWATTGINCPRCGGEQ